MGRGKRKHSQKKLKKGLEKSFAWPGILKKAIPVWKKKEKKQPNLDTQYMLRQRDLVKEVGGKLVAGSPRGVAMKKGGGRKNSRLQRKRAVKEPSTNVEKREETLVESCRNVGLSQTAVRGGNGSNRL